MRKQQAVLEIVTVITDGIRTKYWLICAAERDTQIHAFSMAYTFATDILKLLDAAQTLGFQRELAYFLEQPFQVASGQQFAKVDLARVQRVLNTSLLVSGSGACAGLLPEVH